MTVRTRSDALAGATLVGLAGLGHERLVRSFRPSSRFYLDLRVDATNLLNHRVFTDWNTTVNSTQFGLPIAANPMRSLETSLRLRF